MLELDFLEWLNIGRSSRWSILIGLFIELSFICL